MALNNCEMYINSTGRELKPHGTEDFPCAAYEHFLKKDDDIAWHWHKEMEAIYVKSGGLKVKIPSKQFNLTEGMYLLLNTNVLHYVKATEPCCLQSFVFDASLFGNSSSVLHQKYIDPLLKCQFFDGILWTKQDKPKVIQEFNKAFYSMAKDEKGFEFNVEISLFSSLKEAALQYEDKFMEETSDKETNSRIQIMLHYIHEHFEDNLTVEEIAKQASIGKRECLRCFMKNIQISPMQYLIKYRLMKAAEMLNHDTATVSEVALRCGYESPSNFAMQFKRYYGMSPRFYREKNKLI